MLQTITLTLVIAISVVACSTTKTSAVNSSDNKQQSSATNLTLYDFSDPDADLWQVVNDGVMGGRSKGYFEIEDGHLHFHGNLVTQGGGFTSIMTYRNMDLSPYQGIELRVRGGGRTFALEVNDAMVERRLSRRGTFPTSEEWTWVKVPFSSLKTTFRGQPMDKGPLDASDIRRIGFYMLDGQDGPFELYVDEIRAY